jgi:hypothetical protein
LKIMNALITRGLALAAVTAGLTFFGAGAANAITIGGDDGILGDDSSSNSDTSGSGGLLGTGISLGSGSGSVDHLLSNLHVHAPASVDGAHVRVLDGSTLGDTSSVVGNGVQATTGSTVAQLAATGGLDNGDLIELENLISAAVGVPVDVSGTWASVLGNPAHGDPNGIVVVPNATTDPTAVTTGIVDGIVDVPVTVQCTDVTVLSDFARNCESAGSSGSGSDGNNGSGSSTANGDLTFPVIVEGITASVLDGALDGVLADNDTLVTDGVELYPTASVDPTSVVGGEGSLADLGLTAPITVRCVGIGVLATADPGCGASSDPGDGQSGDDGDTNGDNDGDNDGTGSTDGDNDGTGATGNGGTEGNGNGGNGDTQNPCVAGTSAPAADSASTVDTGLTLGVAGAAGLAGALGAIGLIGIGRKFTTL